jgi:hypothetical protein
VQEIIEVVDDPALAVSSSDECDFDDDEFEDEDDDEHHPIKRW